MMERTLSIIKPNAVESNSSGAIVKMIQESGLKIVAMKMLRLSKAQAEQFYAVHNDKPFFKSLTEFMASGPVIVSILEGDNAIVRYRELMGATDPAKAAEGTIRVRYGQDVEKNSVHGSDSAQNAAVETAFFFNQLEIVG